jgi:hypothetical protein
VSKLGRITDLRAWWNDPQNHGKLSTSLLQYARRKQHQDRHAHNHYRSLARLDKKVKLAMPSKHLS